MNGFRFVPGLFLAFLIGCAGGQSAAPGAEITEPTLSIAPGTAKVFTGPKNIRVEMAELPVGAEAHSLIRVMGTRTFLDGRVLPYSFKRWNRSTEVFSSPHEGYERSWVHILNDERYVLYLPETRDEKVDLKLVTDETPNTRQLLLDYERSKADGSLDAFASYSREREVAAMNERYGEAVAAAQAACPFELTGTMTVDQVSDESLRERRRWLGSYCSPVAAAVERVCTDSPRTAKKLPQLFTSVECAPGAALEMSLDSGRLVLKAVYGESNIQDKVEAFLMAQTLPDDGATVGDLARYEKSKVCSDGNGRYVGTWPSSDPQRLGAVIFGDEKVITETLKDAPLSTGEFYDPREENPERNNVFRGVDYRYVSKVKIDDDAGSCSLRCGVREIPLTLMSPEDTESLLRSAEVGKNPRTRRPFALARDRKQRYFLVDTGLEEGSKDFRVYSGRRGRMELLKMTNVVDDSQGTIFTTKEGTLRLVIEKDTSFWTEGKRTLKLLNVPIWENQHLIYSGLGVYVGTPYGTPCDEL